MRPRIRKFVSREFVKTVDLDLLKAFLAPYADQIGFSWASLPGDDRMKREALYALFAGADERFPSEFHRALFNVMMLSSPSGADLLLNLAEEWDLDLVPGEDLLGRRDGRHVNPRYLALRTYLNHREIFDRALKIVAFRAYSAPLELQGSRPGAPSVHDEPEAVEGLRAAISAYFLRRYQGQYCDVQWYPEEDSIQLLVQHGTKPETKTVERHGNERPLTYREITQDTIQYECRSGYLKVGAKSKKDARTLAELFAHHMLGDADFFSDPQAGLLYTLRPLSEGKFSFDVEWDAEVTGVRVCEVKVDAGCDDARGRRRFSPWSMTVKDNRDAIDRLFRLAPSLDPSSLRLCYAKFEFDMEINGRAETLLVKVTPPGTAAFRDHAHEQKIWEHLERNGIRRCLQSVPTPLAAE